MNIRILIIGLNPDAAIGRVRWRPFANEPIEVYIAAVCMKVTGAVLEDVVPGPSTLRAEIEISQMLSQLSPVAKCNGLASPDMSKWTRATLGEVARHGTASARLQLQRPYPPPRRLTGG